jgi:hypothetical protein
MKTGRHPSLEDAAGAKAADSCMARKLKVASR